MVKNADVFLWLILAILAKMLDQMSTKCTEMCSFWS